MRIWLQVSFLPMSSLPDLVVEAERLGVEGVAFAEHICVPADLQSDYPYTGRRAELALKTEFPEPLTLIASLAAHTTALRFMTCAILVPLRHPVLLARQVATASVLAGGRLDLGVGIGWMREEFDAVGVPFEQRGSRTDESIAVMRRLWSGETVAHAGHHYSFPALELHPSPPPVPLFIGGHSPPALRRAAGQGDGWLGVSPRLDALEDLLTALAAERQRMGTAERPFRVRTGIKGTLDESMIRRAAELGIDALVVAPAQLGLSPSLDGDRLLTAILERMAGIVQSAEAI